MSLRVLHIPDLHLYDEEIGQSVDYPKECVKILEGLIDEFKAGEYHLAILGGDIQHAKINKTYYMSEFQRLLRELGILVKQSLDDAGLLGRLKVVGKGNQVIDISKRESILFSVRGNHDTNALEGFTFFDLLIDNGVIMNPRYIRLGDLQINFLNNSKFVVDLMQEKEEGVKSVVSVFHNAIVEEGVLVDAVIGKTIVPSKTEIFKDVDLALVNHIHMPIPAYDVVSNHKKTIVVTPGSLGRTAFDKSHDRDYGNLVRIDVDNNYDINLQIIEMELTPSEEFFDKVKVFEQKRVENAFENFSIEIEDMEISYFNIEEEIIRNVEDEEIRDIALRIVRER